MAPSWATVLLFFPHTFEFRNTPLMFTPSLVGLVMGKAEGKGTDWHGHVTAVTVAPEYRRLGLAEHFMTFLEEVSEKK